MNEELIARQDRPDKSGTVLCTEKPELRVLQVFSGLGMGGAETWLMSLLKYFREQRENLPVTVKFDVLLTSGEKVLFDDEAVALGAKLFYVPFTRRNLAGFAKEYRKILATGNYDAIHDHQDYIAGLHFLLGAGHLPPIRIAHVHNPFYHRRSHETGVITRTTNFSGQQLVARLATHVMGTSRQIVSEYGFDESVSSKVVLGAVHCGFDVTRYSGDYLKAHADLCRELGWQGSSKIILFVGRLEGAEMNQNGRQLSHKNPAFALEVAKEAIAKDNSVRLLMVGAGDEKRRELETRVAQWELSDKIRFLGTRSDVPRLMLASDLLLFPSLAEGLGMVVVEAQAAGLPVLASDSTPRECVVVSDLVEFISLSETPERWSARALSMLDVTVRKGEEPNRAVRESAFSIDHSAARLISLYSGSPLSQ